MPKIDLSDSEISVLVAHHLKRAQNQTTSPKGDSSIAQSEIARAVQLLAAASPGQLPLHGPASTDTAQQPEPSPPPQAPQPTPKEFRSPRGILLSDQPACELRPTTKAKIIPTCIGRFFENERSPCPRCSRHDVCVRLTRTIEQDSDFATFWREAELPEKIEYITKNKP
jgi:hypothetical protein